MNRFLAIIKEAAAMLTTAIALIIFMYFLMMAGTLGALAAIDMVGFDDMIILIDSKQ